MKTTNPTQGKMEKSNGSSQQKHENMTNNESGKKECGGIYVILIAQYSSFYQSASVYLC